MSNEWIAWICTRMRETGEERRRNEEHDAMFVIVYLVIAVSVAIICGVLWLGWGEGVR